MPSSFVKVKIQNPETLADNKNYEVGEIIVQGDSLMSGYYKTPIEKQDFDEKGWFHTGDLGFMDDDGYLHFAGRKKEIIIKGGENILPNEVASAISEEACVANVQVFGVPHEFWGEQVAAAILLKPGYTFNKEEFLAHVATKLAKIKVPDHVYVFEEFPTLANGKTDLINLKKMIIAKIKEEA
jgi:fatty-acyl-CoA synthase